MIFRYDERAKKHLCEQDAKLGSFIKTFGDIEREMQPDLFEALTNSIISQQISGKAAMAIYSRLKAAAGELTPAVIAALPEPEIRQCGISQRKTAYIKTAADAILTGTLNPARLQGLDNEEVIGVLTQLPGIGRWSAEMILIFSLGREDVLSYGDFGIRRGIMKLHSLSELSKKQFHHYQTLYSPYGSIASFYLWEIAAL